MAVSPAIRSKVVVLKKTQNLQKNSNKIDLFLTVGEYRMPYCIKQEEDLDEDDTIRRKTRIDKQST